MKHVCLENITKLYGDIRAADNVNLDIEKHEFVTLLGPSGSGKTTTLMILVGFVKADSGCVLIGGNDITKFPAHRRNIGMVFQNYALFPHMTVLENVSYPLKMRRIPRNEARRMAEEILEVVKLEGLGQRRPSQLSGGQQQRVALARALVFRPPLLLMDEPLGALDKKLRDHMQLELKKIQRQLKITILYVTHDQEEALAMSDRIAIMNHGQIEQIGSPSEVYNHPSNQFVADFVGESNFLHAEIVKVQDDSIYISGPWEKDIRVRAVKSFHSGQIVELCIRPEKVVFIEKDDPRYCSCRGIIEHILFLGEITKYYVRLSYDHSKNREEVIVINDQKKSREEVIVINDQNRFGKVKYEDGDHVKIGWNENDAMIV